MSAWPFDYNEQLSGVACTLCAEGRPEETGGRIRFFSSQWSDGYLHFGGVQRGYAAVIWRGRHVVEPTDLAEEEATAFWFDVLQVGRAMQGVYHPLKINYQLLGNRIPQLHWLLGRGSWTMWLPVTLCRGRGITIFPRTRCAGRLPFCARSACYERQPAIQWRGGYQRSKSKSRTVVYAIAY